MKSVVLVPYCPFPVDTGGKAEIVKHLNLLRVLGPCRIASASSKPVGAGWTRETLELAKKRGFDVVLREDSIRGWNAKQSWGMAYGLICKGLGLERAFHHANPYHRYAFPVDWWRKVSDGADIAVFNYSYWSWLPCEMPKTLVLLDLWSDYMWGGHTRETKDIRSCDHTFVISMDEVSKLQSRGVEHVSWSPPAIDASDFELKPFCALIGSNNLFNIEGLRWLESASAEINQLDIRVYGGLAASIKHPGFNPVGRYENNDQPFQECGIALFTTTQGMGVQIKTIEALAAGRAIIARRGAVRGLPQDGDAWIEVDTPSEMIDWAKRLGSDQDLLAHWGLRAKTYYQRHLDATIIRSEMARIYRKLAKA